MSLIFYTPRSIASFENDIHPDFYVSPKNADGTYQDIGFMGVFRNGLFQEFSKGGTYQWTVPEDVTKIRVRTVGRSATAGGAYQGRGGGGYAHGIFDVSPGDVFTVNIPNSSSAPGLTSASFVSSTLGTLLQGHNSVGNAGGSGWGGSYQSSGGPGGSSTGSDGFRPPGGGSGSQVSKIGGTTTKSSTAGGAVKWNSSGGYAGGAGGSALVNAHGPGISLVGKVLPPGFPRFPFDGFYGSGGSRQPGAGGSSAAYPGVGGGVGSYRTGDSVIMGGGAHCYPGGYTLSGLVVVEW